MHLKEVPNSEATILARVIQPDHDDLSSSAARALLKLSFASDDRERMHELVVKNQDGTLTVPEERELDSYVRVGRLVDLLAAKARLSLKKTRPKCLNFMDEKLTQLSGSEPITAVNTAKSTKTIAD